MTLAISFIFNIFLAAVMFALELRITYLNNRLRNVERALSSMNKKYND